VVFLREITFEQLRRQQDGNVRHFMTYLLYGLPGLQLNLLLRITKDVIRFVLCLVFEFFTQTFGVCARLGDDRFGFYTCLLHHLCRFLLEPFQLLSCPVRVLQRLPDSFLPDLERLEERAPCELCQQRQQNQERDNSP